METFEIKVCAEPNCTPRHGWLHEGMGTLETPAEATEAPAPPQSYAHPTDYVD